MEKPSSSMALSPRSRQFVFVSSAFLIFAGVAGGLWTFWGRDLDSSTVSQNASAPTRVESGRGARSTGEKRSVAACLADMAEGKKYPLPTRAQLEAYIEQEGRSAGSLLAAFMLSTETVPWLDEAAERYPDDPRVSAVMLMTARGRKEPTAEWSRRMRANDPKNSLGWCNEALDAFKAGDVEGGLDALEDAARLGRPHMYPEEIAREITKASKSAGFDPLYAETLGYAHLPLGQLSVLMELAQHMKTGPEGARESATESLFILTQSLKQPTERAALVEKLVSSSIERTIVNSSEWYEEMPGLNMTAAELQERNSTERAATSALIKEHRRLLPSLSDTEMKQYLRRIAVEGEFKAMQWVVQTKGAVK